MDIIQLVVIKEEEFTRLDKYLVTHCDLTRSRIQQLIDEGSILVNDKKEKANYKVKVNDMITLKYPDEVSLEAKAEKMDLDIRYEDSDVIVINKAKGIVVHPANGNQSNTLVNGLLYHCQDLSGINGVLRPGIVHRIDKDTTGLLICAKNDKAHLCLSEQLSKKEVSRMYYALVHGVIEHDFGTIDAPIGRDVKDRQKMAVTATNSKEARTHFKVIERFKNHTLVECRLETGRTHQIRVHMQYIGYPLVGDEKYSYRKTVQGFGQFLHAFSLTFTHPTTKEVMTIEAPLPKYFVDYLQTLREE